MKFLEFAVVTITIVLGYIFAFAFTTKDFLAVMNFTLLIFYLLFALGKLPEKFYPKQEYRKSWEFKISVLGAVATFGLYFLAIVCRNHLQLFGRIGLLVMFFIAMAILQSSYFKRLFGDFPKDRFLRNHITYIRCVIVFCANLLILPHMTYTSKTVRTKDGMVYEVTRDGFDTYETMYVDSLSCYVTISHLALADSVVYVKYHSAYDKYKITKVDTVPSTNYKVGYMKSFLQLHRPKSEAKD